VPGVRDGLRGRGPGKSPGDRPQGRCRRRRWAGRDFAAQAPGGPSFEHFKTILSAWKQGGALVVEHVRDTDRVLTFSVTRCLYVEAYRAMGVPAEVLPLLSCARDSPFASAYHPALELDRPCTLAGGADACLFRFTWRD
jgi:hypothetical protein